MEDSSILGGQRARDLRDPDGRTAIGTGHRARLDARSVGTFEQRPDFRIFVVHQQSTPTPPIEPLQSSQNDLLNAAKCHSASEMNDRRIGAWRFSH